MLPIVSLRQFFMPYEFISLSIIPYFCNFFKVVSAVNFAFLKSNKKKFQDILFVPILYFNISFLIFLHHLRLCITDFLTNLSSLSDSTAQI